MLATRVAVLAFAVAAAVAASNDKKVDELMEPVAGLDHGASYSSAGINESGRVEIVPRVLGIFAAPSHAAQDGDERLIGDAAKIEATERPVKTSATRSAEGGAPVDGRGLLTGVVAADGAFYARRLGDLRAARVLLTTPGLLWEAALADAAARGQTGDAYISSVSDRAQAFFESGVLVDRTATMSKLGKLMGASKGEFVLFLGGMDIGKSLLLANLTATLASQGRRVVLMDARSKGGDLLAGLVSAFRGRPGWLENVVASVPEAARAAMPGIVQTAAASTVPGAANGSVAKLLGKWLGTFVSALSAASVTTASLPTLEELLLGFIAASKDEGRFPVLIIDEANKALPSSPDEARTRTRDALDLLTRLTKQTRELNVLLAASEHAEPFRLAQLGFKTGHMTKTVIACEVPPAEMLAMLQREWGCGPELAAGLAAVYGGNVWRTSRALNDLASEKAGFQALSGFTPSAIRGAVAVVRAARSGRPEMAGLEGMLRSIADRGYVAVSDDTDARVELVSAHNVGGVVSAGASAPGVPPEARVGGDTLLVASSQDMRLLLAMKLVDADTAESK